MLEAAKYSAVETLRNGRQVEIRALRPDDRADLVAAVGRASAQSLYRRFFGVRHSFTEFAFFGGVPRSILYNNTRLAVARIRGDGTRERTRGFAELQSHYLFLDRFGRPGKGNDKGKVEGLVGYARRNFLVPIPTAASFTELNARLEQHCLDRLSDRLRGHALSIGE